MINTIYLLTNTINGKKYVGQTWEAKETRWQKHYSSSEKTCVKLNRAIAKYGKEAFAIETLTTAKTQEKADRLEAYYIEQYDTITNGYNIRSGGSRGKHSDETKKKMSLVHRGVQHSDEAKKKMSVARKGVPLKHNKQFKIGQVSPFKGKSHSEESRHKLSLSHQGSRPYRRKVNHEDVIAEYKSGGVSSSGLSKKYDVSKAQICRILKSAGVDTQMFAIANFQRYIEEQKNV